MGTTRKSALQRLVAGVAMTGMAGAVAAASDTTNTAVAPSAHWSYQARMLGPERIDRGLAGAFQKLNLSPDQHRQVNDILAQAHQRFTTEQELAESDSSALLNPGSTEFAHFVRVAKEDVAARIDLAAKTEQRLYNVLTPSQKAKLPAAMASMYHRYARQ